MTAPHLGRARWTRSSYSTNTGDCVEVAALPSRWVKSSFSTNTADCVEVGAVAGHIAVRDSKDVGGPALIVPAAAWSSFVGRLRRL